MLTKTSATRALAAPASALVVRWDDPQLPHIWQIGYEIDGAFSPFAAGGCEVALQKLIEKERAREPYAGYSDRRQQQPPRRPPFGRAPSHL